MYCCFRLQCLMKLVATLSSFKCSTLFSSNLSTFSGLSQTLSDTNTVIANKTELTGLGLNGFCDEIFTRASVYDRQMLPNIRRGLMFEQDAGLERISSDYSGATDPLPNFQKPARSQLTFLVPSISIDICSSQQCPLGQVIDSEQGPPFMRVIVTVLKFSHASFDGVSGITEKCAICFYCFF